MGCSHHRDWTKKKKKLGKYLIFFSCTMQCEIQIIKAPILHRFGNFIQIWYLIIILNVIKEREHIWTH